MRGHNANDADGREAYSCRHLVCSRIVCALKSTPDEYLVVNSMKNVNVPDDMYCRYCMVQGYVGWSELVGSFTDDASGHFRCVSSHLGMPPKELVTQVSRGIYLRPLICRF